MVYDRHAARSAARSNGPEPDELKDEPVPTKCLAGTEYQVEIARVGATNVWHVFAAAVRNASFEPSSDLIRARCSRAGRNAGIGKGGGLRHLLRAAGFGPTKEPIPRCMAASGAGRRRGHQLRELIIKPPFAIPSFRPIRCSRMSLAKRPMLY
eukprot:3249453-Pyramimonas_sp.AAC.1